MLRLFFIDLMCNFPCSMNRKIENTQYEDDAFEILIVSPGGELVVFVVAEDGVAEYAAAIEDMFDAAVGCGVQL